MNVAISRDELAALAWDAGRFAVTWETAQELAYRRRGWSAEVARSWRFADAVFAKLNEARSSSETNREQR